MVKITQNAVTELLKFVEIPCKVLTSEVGFGMSFQLTDLPLSCLECSCTIANGKQIPIALF